MLYFYSFRLVYNKLRLTYLVYPKNTLYLYNLQKTTKMKTLNLLAFSLLFPFCLLSQDLVIEYDVTSDKITFKDTSGTIIKRPAAKKNRNVLLRLTNFNDYTLHATISAKGINQKVADGNINLVGGKMLGQENTNFMSFFQSSASIMDQTISTPSRTPSPKVMSSGIMILEEELEPQKKDKLSATNEQKIIALRQIEQNYKQTTSELEIINQQLIDSERKIIDHKNTLLLTEYAAPYVKSIKLNERLATSRRKALLQEMMSALFQTNKQDVNLSDILDFFATFEGKVSADLSKFDRLFADFSNKHDELRSFEPKIIQHFSDDIPLAVSLQNQYKNDNNYYGQIEDDLTTFNAMTQSFKHNLPNINIPLLFDNIYRNYLEINLNPFEYSFTTPAEGDIMDFEITISRKDSTKSNSGLLKKRHIKVPVKGGVKVNTSVGIGFSNYFQPTESYYNRDSTIFAEPGDQFTPLLVTLIHFYPQTGRQITVGGSFGVGIPLSGDFKSPSFLLGPSIFAGKSERIIISAGLMGAKASRLAQGHVVNEHFGAENLPVPIKTRYELGYFLSASFNLAK